MESKIYKKYKMFKSSLRIYYVELEIVKRYSTDKSKLIINLYTDDKKYCLDYKIMYISNYYNNTDLDNYSKSFIDEYEDWKDIGL